MADCGNCTVKEEVQKLREKVAVHAKTAEVTEKQVNLICQKLAGIKEAVDKNDGRAGVRDSQIKSILEFVEEVRGKWFDVLQRVEDVDSSVKESIRSEVEKMARKTSDIEACLRTLKRIKPSEAGWRTWLRQLGQDSFRAALVNILWVFCTMVIYSFCYKEGVFTMIDQTIRHFIGR